MLTCSGTHTRTHTHTHRHPQARAGTRQRDDMGWRARAVSATALQIKSGVAISVAQVHRRKWRYMCVTRGVRRRFGITNNARTERRCPVALATRRCATPIPRRAAVPRVVCGHQPLSYSRPRPPRLVARRPLQNIAPAAARGRAAGGASRCARVQDVRCDGSERDASRPASHSTSRVAGALLCHGRRAWTRRGGGASGA